MRDKSDTPRTDRARDYRADVLARNARLIDLAEVLERELTAALKDAERYRWLREHSHETPIGAYEWVERNGRQQRAYLAFDELDTAIDAAIAAEKQLPPA